MKSNIILTEIRPVPTDVRIYYENGVPYLDYTGWFDTNEGRAKVHFPKISLSIKVIDQEAEYAEYYGKYNILLGQVMVGLEIVATNEQWFKYEIVEREMTKSQIEKEIGCKVKIVEDKK